MQTGLRGRDLISLQEWKTEEVETILEVAARLKLDRNKTIRAQWGPAVSKRKLVRVKPVVKSNLRKVRLFSKARVHGKVSPAQDGRRINAEHASRLHAWWDR